jgi:hypothetical protein
MEILINGIYIQELIQKVMHSKISNGNVVFELLKDTYDEISEIDLRKFVS